MIKIGRITLALTVIAIGGIWLLSIWNPALANTLSMYWPVVFIFYGFEVIITSFFKQSKKISIWLLIVSVVLAFTAASFLENKSFNWQFVWNLDGILENGITEQVDLQQPLAQTEAIEVAVTNGRIEVFPSENDEVQFVGSAIWQQNTANPQLTLTLEGDTWVIQNENLISLQGKLYLPQAIQTLQFTSTNGALQINEKLDNLAILAETTNGVVEAFSGEQAEITTVNGNVSLEDIEVLTVTTVNGDVEVQGQTTDANIQTQQGRVEVTSETLQATNIRTVNGKIELAIPENGVQIKAQTVNGSIEIFDKEYEKNILINQNSSDKQILLETVNGAIEVNTGE